jgi:hypothetical protein
VKIAPAPFYREGISFQNSEESDVWSPFLPTPKGSQNEVRQQHNQAAEASKGKCLQHLIWREKVLLGLGCEGSAQEGVQRQLLLHCKFGQSISSEETKGCVRLKRKCWTAEKLCSGVPPCYKHAAVTSQHHVVSLCHREGKKKFLPCLYYL